MRAAVVMSICFLLSAAAPAFADDVLPSRDLELPLALPVTPPLLNFDLIDLQVAEFNRQHPVLDQEPHSMFDIKTHVGGAAGWDNGNPHASIGLYLTIAEWGRWNFGVPAAALGFGRYREYDSRQGQAVLKDGLTVIVSMASVHYRVGYIKSFGLHWYINLEQIYDMRNNMSGSQFGLSFSRK
jgi:hypothetical protein